MTAEVQEKPKFIMIREDWNIFPIKKALRSQNDLAGEKGGRQRIMKSTSLYFFLSCTHTEKDANIRTHHPRAQFHSITQTGFRVNKITSSCT